MPGRLFLILVSIAQGCGALRINKKKGKELKEAIAQVDDALRDAVYSHAAQRTLPFDSGMLPDRFSAGFEVEFSFFKLVLLNGDLPQDMKYEQYGKFRTESGVTLLLGRDWQTMDGEKRWGLEIQTEPMEIELAMNHFGPDISKFIHEDVTQKLVEKWKPEKGTVTLDWAEVLKQFPQFLDAMALGESSQTTVDFTFMFQSREQPAEVPLTEKNAECETVYLRAHATRPYSEENASVSDSDADDVQVARWTARYGSMFLGCMEKTFTDNFALFNQTAIQGDQFQSRLQLARSVVPACLAVASEDFPNWISTFRPQFTLGVPLHRWLCAFHPELHQNLRKALGWLTGSNARRGGPWHGVSLALQHYKRGEIARGIAGVDEESKRTYLAFLAIVHLVLYQSYMTCQGHGFVKYGQTFMIRTHVGQIYTELKNRIALTPEEVRSDIYTVAGGLMPEERIFQQRNLQTGNRTGDMKLEIDGKPTSIIGPTLKEYVDELLEGRDALSDSFLDASYRDRERVFRSMGQYPFAAGKVLFEFRAMPGFHYFAKLRNSINLIMKYFHNVETNPLVELPIVASRNNEPATAGMNTELASIPKPSDFKFLPSVGTWYQSRPAVLQSLE